MTKYIEVEIKRVLDIPVEEFIKRLIAQSYKRASEKHEVDIYYSRPDVDFMKTVECLRIRKKSGYAEITYKPPTKAVDMQDGSGITAKRETDVVLADTAQVKQTESLFESLGFIRLATVDKRRESYIHPERDGVTVAIDTVKEAGVYIEIEVMSENESEARKLINDIEKELQTNAMKLVTKPYRDLVMESGSA